MYLTTNSPRMERLRKNIVELVLTDYDRERLKTEDHGANELCSCTTWCSRSASTSTACATRGAQPPGHAHGHQPPYMVSDLSACISCYRCVRACDEVQGEFVLTMAGRGFENHIVKGTGGLLRQRLRELRRLCAICPTSAITGCVPQQGDQTADRIVRTVCTYCGVGCNLDVRVKDEKVVAIRAPYDAEANAGHTCLKGRYAFSFYDHPDRLRTP